MTNTAKVDCDNPAANMYGCLPCPKCQSEYRWPTRDVHPTDPSMILCDDCGFKEKIVADSYTTKELQR